MEEIVILEVLIQYNAGEVRVCDAWQVQERKEMEEVLQSFIDETGYESVRGVEDWVDEWEAHNTLREWGLWAERVGDCDLEEAEAWWKRCGYKCLNFLKRVYEGVMGVLGDLFNVNKKKDVISREGQMMYLGKKYSREEGTGYMVCTTGDRKRLHVAMWEAAAGRRVPEGCVIHHVNWDKTVNEIGNLVCLTVAEHERVHNTPGGREFGEKLKKERGIGLPPGLD